MARISLADFEARYRADPDPWGYATSDYERDKYAATLAACGEGPFADALELGGSIGVFSELLAPRCERLTTIDGAPTAVAAARRRLAGAPQVDVILGEIPDAVPPPLRPRGLLRNPLLPDRFRALPDAGAARVGDGARGLHGRDPLAPPGPERPLDADEVHATLRRQPWLLRVTSGDTDDYRLDVLERQ